LAIVDISRDALRHCADKFHIPNTFEDVDEMLQKVPEVDVVMIMNAK
jgi:predicted dehydrogenase